MSSPIITLNESKLMRNYIAEHSGIALPEDKTYLLDTRLSGLLAESGCADYIALLRLAVDEPSQNLKNRLIDAMTTNETLWFRDIHPFTILKDKVMPTLANELRSGTRRKVRIWSAASSTGQEPYSIAIALRELCRTEAGLRPEHIEIVATDISPTVLAAARTGCYDSIALGRGLSDDLRNRYFRRNGNCWVVDDEIKRMVQFQRFNLQESPFSLGVFDIVFCRYVAIYFNERFKRDLYARFARVLAPGGSLFISAVENLRGISEEFQPHEHAGGTYYQLN